MQEGLSFTFAVGWTPGHRYAMRTACFLLTVSLWVCCTGLRYAWLIDRAVRGAGGPAPLRLALRTKIAVTLWHPTPDLLSDHRHQTKRPGLTLAKRASEA